MRAWWTSSGMYTPHWSDFLVGTQFRWSFDHFVLWQSVGGTAGADWAWAEREGCRASEMWGMVAVSWDAIAFAPPHRTRFPFGVHLMADTLTWVVGEQLREALMVVQILAGGSLMSSGQVYATASTTMLGHCGEAAFAA